MNPEYIPPYAQTYSCCMQNKEPLLIKILKSLIASILSSSKSLKHQYSSLIFKSRHIWNYLKDTVYDFEYFSEITYTGTGSFGVFCLVGFGWRDVFGFLKTA